MTSDIRPSRFSVCNIKKLGLVHEAISLGNYYSWKGVVALIGTTCRLAWVVAGFSAPPHKVKCFKRKHDCEKQNQLTT